MRIFIGSYRKRDHIENCLRSIHTFVERVDDIVVIDDSGDRYHRAWLRDRHNVMVIPTDVRASAPTGFDKTMGTACTMMSLVCDDEYCSFWEEDFTLNEPVDLDELADEMENSPQLAQVALLRQPCFPSEIEAGGVIEALGDCQQRLPDGTVLTGAPAIRLQGRHSGLWYQQTVFTTNPAVWRAPVWRSGWPTGECSEAAKTVELRDAGWWFAWREGVVVKHEGERKGCGY